jgi:hypothetical protein
MGKLAPGSHKIEFDVAAADDAGIATREHSIFLVQSGR